MKAKTVKYIVFLSCLILLILMGVYLFQDRQYAAVSLIFMVLACLPYFWHFEHSSVSASHICLLAVMTSLSVIGRIVFAAVPFFKPVSAMVIIAGIYMGGDMGFICGAASAIVSNIYFGQGPWTPFQMFSWGVIGLVAGLLGKKLKKSLLLTCIYGAIAGVAYSLLMDLWSALWMDGEINIERYIGLIVVALPVTCIYVVSNIIFLIVLAKPLGRKLEHTMKKW